jgi:uncharacterized damage-inducible protein DinB
LLTHFSEYNRPEPPSNAPPIEIVDAFLDFQRATLLWKLDGLSDEQLRRPMTKSGVSLLKLLKHCAYVERYWFHYVLGGLDVDTGWTAEDPDADWRLDEGDTYESLRALYISVNEKSRELVKTFEWEDPAKRMERGFHCGWIMSHMLEEISRHNGQIDLIREEIDGLVGE